MRTISRYLEQNGEELSENGYEVLRGKNLKSFLVICFILFNTSGELFEKLSTITISSPLFNNSTAV